MANTWMVRSSGGERIEDFRKGFIGIGFGNIDVTDTTDPAEIRRRYEQSHPNEKPGTVSAAVAMIRKFRSVVQVGDNVVTYDPAERRYFLGTVDSDYLLKPGVITGLSQIRKVKWFGEVPRDALSVSSRNALGATLTLFAVAA